MRQHARANPVELLLEVHVLIQEPGVDLGEGAEARDGKEENDEEWDLHPRYQQAHCIDHLVQLEPGQVALVLEQHSDALVGSRSRAAMGIDEFHGRVAHPGPRRFCGDLRHRPPRPVACVVQVVRVLDREDDVDARDPALRPPRAAGVLVVGELLLLPLSLVVEPDAGHLQRLRDRQRHDLSLPEPAQLRAVAPDEHGQELAQGQQRDAEHRVHVARRHLDLEGPERARREGLGARDEVAPRRGLAGAGVDGLLDEGGRYEDFVRRLVDSAAPVQASGRLVHAEVGRDLCALRVLEAPGRRTVGPIGIPAQVPSAEARVDGRKGRRGRHVDPQVHPMDGHHVLLVDRHGEQKINHGDKDEQHRCHLNHIEFLVVNRDPLSEVEQGHHVHQPHLCRLGEGPRVCQQMGNGAANALDSKGAT
mmetsp:Transcript_15056/g.43909  ORF Transcript_15056/g.43909 Transcript_15056/m.43909 type:complete len:420 (-) Transcript_15056:8-1267(-)